MIHWKTGAWKEGSWKTGSWVEGIIEAIRRAGKRVAAKLPSYLISRNPFRRL